MSKKRAVPLLVLPLVAGGAVAQAESYPFVGKWDCGGETFTFTDTSYDSGTGAQAVVGVAAEGSGFILTLASKQEVIVSEFTDSTMVWLLWSTGERRNCTRAG